MVTTDLIRGACVAFMATFYLLGLLQPWMLLLITLTISTAEAFRGPANTAMTPRVLDRECLEYGMSLHSTLSKVVELVGMAAAAGIIALLGVAGAIYIDMATFILSAVIIMFVDSKEKDLKKQPFEAAGYFNDLKEGFAFVKRKKTIRFLVMLCLFLNAMLVPFNSLQAPLAGEVLGGGAELLSIMGIMLTVGMLLGSSTYPVVQEKISQRVLICVGCVGIGAFYLGTTFFQPLYANRWFLYGWVALLSALFGYCMVLVITWTNVAIVKLVDQQYLARVGGIVTALGCAANPVASFIISIAVVYTGTKLLFILVGVIDLICCILIMFNRALDEAEEENPATGNDAAVEA